MTFYLTTIFSVSVPTFSVSLNLLDILKMTSIHLPHTVIHLPDEIQKTKILKMIPESFFKIEIIKNGLNVRRSS